MAKCPRNAFPRRPTVTRFSRDAFPGALPWQDFAAMRSRAAIRGKIRTPCIRNELALARYARHASEMPRKSPSEDTPREDLARKGTFRCTGPSNHARRANLAIRRRTARAIATTAPPLRAAERGAGGFLSGGVTLPKECVVLWGVERWRQSWHQRSAACKSLTPIILPNLESQHSRGGFRAGRRQGGAGQAAPPSEARVLATSSSAFKEKVNPLVLLLLTIPPGGI